MVQDVCPMVAAKDRPGLEAIAADRNRAQKHVLRVRVVLPSAERPAVADVARRVGAGRCAAWRGQRRFAEAGVGGLLRDATRTPGRAALADDVVRRVVAPTCAERAGEATQWTGRAVVRAGQRICAAPHAQPHRIRSFKCSSDPASANKLHAIVGLYVDPPA